MAAKLSVIFYIILCLEVGIVLTLLPWYAPFGLSDWGDNFFLLYAAQKTGLYGLQHAVASGWVRGAVTGLGLINLAAGVWEIVHFRQSVSASLAAPAAPAVEEVPEVMPGPVAVWVTAVLSLMYFSIEERIQGSTLWIPLGIFFTIWCWRLVARAHRVGKARGIPVPPSYNTAVTVALVLGALNLLNAIRLLLF
jgi:hypothetical protein